MLPIQRKISPYNHYKGNDIKYIVIHYIGATGTAKNNADYFYGGDRQASAHYFVGETECWQSVEDFNGAWHVGNTRTEVNNKNSIGIEMECANPQLFVTDKTMQNTCELVVYLMKKYNIPIGNVRTHYEVSGKTKLCPNFANTSRWTDMKNKISAMLNGTTSSSATTNTNKSNNNLCRVLVNGTSKIALTGLQKCIDYVKANYSKEEVKIQRVSDSAILWTQAKYVAPVTNNSTDEVRRYAENGVFYPNTTINFRNAPNTSSSNPVQGQYKKGESVKYDTVVIGNRYNWISWISASTKQRRYMPIKDKQTGESWGYAK